MTGINPHFDLRFGPRLVRGAMAALMLSAGARELGSESVTLTTYYPAPSGIYTRMITTGDTYLARDGGVVGIGTASPSGKLHVLGNVFVESGKVGIGTTSPAATLDVEGGNLKVGGSVQAGLVYQSIVCNPYAAQVAVVVCPSGTNIISCSCSVYSAAGIASSGYISTGGTAGCGTYPGTLVRNGATSANSCYCVTGAISSGAVASAACLRVSN